MPFTEVIYFPLNLVKLLLSIIETEGTWHLLITQHFASLKPHITLASLYDYVCSTGRELTL